MTRGRGLKTGNTGRKKPTKVKGGRPAGKKRTSALKSESETDGLDRGNILWLAWKEKKKKRKKQERKKGVI